MDQWWVNFCRLLVHAHSYPQSPGLLVPSKENREQFAALLENKAFRGLQDLVSVILCILQHYLPASN